MKIPHCVGPLFHRWSRWESYPARFLRHHTIDRLTGTSLIHDPPIEGTEQWERRHCEDCGATQHRKIRNF